MIFFCLLDILLLYLKKKKKEAKNHLSFFFDAFMSKTEKDYNIIETSISISSGQKDVLTIEYKDSDIKKHIDSEENVIQIDFD